MNDHIRGSYGPGEDSAGYVVVDGEFRLLADRTFVRVDGRSHRLYSPSAPQPPILRTIGMMDAERADEARVDSKDSNEGR